MWKHLSSGNVYYYKCILHTKNLPLLNKSFKNKNRMFNYKATEYQVKLKTSVKYMPGVWIVVKKIKTNNNNVRHSYRRINKKQTYFDTMHMGLWQSSRSALAEELRKFCTYITGMLRRESAGWQIKLDPLNKTL